MDRLVWAWPAAVRRDIPPSALRGTVGLTAGTGSRTVARYTWVPVARHPARVLVNDDPAAHPPAIRAVET